MIFVTVGTHEQPFNRLIQKVDYEKVQRLKLQGFTDWAMQHWTFANDHGQNPQMQLAQRYVAHWSEMREKNVGLLLWGGVGTGKSFMAGCIQFIQALLEANGLAAGKDHQFKGRYDAEKNAVIISLEKDEQSALSPQKCTT